MTRKPRTNGADWFRVIVDIFQIIGAVAGVLSVLIAVVALIYAVRNPEQVVKIVQIFAGVTPTPTNVVPSPTTGPTKTPALPTMSPTFTPIPPTPTATPLPTATPSDTPPGSTLRVGEEWRQNGVTLRVDSSEFYSKFQINTFGLTEEHMSALRVQFILENGTGQTLLLNFDKSDFLVRDNVGNSYAVHGIAVGNRDKQDIREKVADSLQNGQRLYIVVRAGMDIAIDRQATQMIVRIANLSRITNATWTIDAH